MKKLFFATFFIGIVIQLNAQVNPTGRVQTNQVKLISPAKSVIIRNDLSDLNTRSAQTCDSISMIQKRIADIMKELQSTGAQEEATKAVIVQDKMDRLNKSIEMITELTKKMHDMMMSIIQNIKG